MMAQDRGPPLPPPDSQERIELAPSPAQMLVELNKRIGDVVNSIAEAERREHDAASKIRDADDDMDSARGRHDAAEQEKHAAAEERQRQLARFVDLLQEALHDLKPAPPPRPPEVERREPERRFRRPYGMVRRGGAYIGR